MGLKLDFLLSGRIQIDDTGKQSSQENTET